MNHIPWLVYDSINYLKSILTDNMELFEYGSGSSTLFFSKLVKSVVSIEHNKAWFDKSYELTRECDNVDLRLAPVSKKKLPEEKEKYAKSICSEKDLDFIIVDGVNRIRCIELGMPLLKSGGYLLLDNSDRWQYQQGIDMLDKWEQKEFYGNGPYNNYKWKTTIWRKP